MYQFPHYSDEVPDCLKSGRCWVGCDARKVPEIVGTTRRASHSDPSTWRTYEAALEAYNKEEHVGIGRVFREDDPFVGVDLDHVRNAEGITDEALEILQLLNSYSEVSPSGNGIKVWVRASLERAYKKPGLEIYPHRRFFTATGQILSQGSAEVEGRESELHELVRRGFPRPKPCRRAGTDYDGPEMDVEDYLAYIEVLKEIHDGLGRKFSIVCPWLSEHTSSKGVRTGTRVGQRHGGGLWFHCDHAHCTGRKWREFKKKVLPGFRMQITRPGYTGNMEAPRG